jgi:hypothetical protein
MNHPDFNKYPDYMRNYQVVNDHSKDCCYITLDISAQDWSFTPALLFLCLLFRLFYCDFSSTSEMEKFLEMFAVESGWVNAKLVQWFGGYYYIMLGVMASGYLGTSHIDTLMSIITFYMASILLAREDGIHPKEVIENVFPIFYGDDTAIRMDRKYLSLYGCDKSSYPYRLANTCKTLGVVLKPGETYIVVPCETHKDRFYTHIEDDVIISPGVHILQRYFVKYSRDHRPLHPDAPNCSYIRPWRVTTAYCTKMGTDAFGWKGKPGRLDPRESFPPIQFYIKLFGLLCDAGPNKTAHYIIKAAMRRIVELYPGVNVAASQGLFKDTIGETLIRLGFDFKVANNLCSEIVFQDDEVSYKKILSYISVAAGTSDIKFPNWRTCDMDHLLNTKTEFRYFCREGRVLQFTINKH